MIDRVVERKNQKNEITQILDFFQLILKDNKNNIDSLLFSITKLYPKYIDLNLSRLKTTK